jgi:hypothetical protein
MAERPRVVSTNLVKWDIYLARPAPAKLLGAVEAASERRRDREGCQGIQAGPDEAPRGAAQVMGSPPGAQRFQIPLTPT